MKIRWQKNVFVPHAGEESVVWCPRTEGCTVMNGAVEILSEIKNVGRERDEIVKAVAAKFEWPLGYDEDCFIKVEADVADVCGELESQGFVAVERKNARIRETSANGILDGMETSDSDAESSPLGDFCERHGIPRDLHLDLTDACTERCVHCYVPQNQHDFLPYETVEKMLREFRALNGLTVHLTGGEAMLYPAFERICRLCVELNLNFIIFSNMTLCNAKRIAFLKEVDPQFINVSLYSMNPEIHDAITRRPGSWAKTLPT